MAKKKAYKNKRAAAKKHPRIKDPVVEIQVSSTAPRRVMAFFQAMDLANDFSVRGHPQVAQKIYFQLMEQCPERREPAVHLLRVLYHLGRVNAAKVQAHRMLAAFKDDAHVFAEVAAIYNLLGEVDRALELLQQGLDVCPCRECTVLYRNLGIIHDARGEREEALDCYHQALDISENDVISLFRLVEIRDTESRDEILKKLLEIEQRGLASENEKPYLYFALAHLYENRDNEKYFKNLKIANNAMAIDSTAYLHRLESYLEEALSNLSTGYVSNLETNLPSMGHAPIFVVAPPRSGTTLLTQILGAHPDVRSVGESGAFVASVNRVSGELGEAPSFWRWGEKSLHNALHSLEKNFLSHERIPNEEDIAIVDKSIENFQFAGLVPLVWPDARIIHLKRHPLDTILSCYHQFFEGGRDRFFDLKSLARYYVIVQRYMDLWKRLFPENILTLEYESLVDDQEGETRRLLEFCGLSWDGACIDFHKRVGRILTASNQQVRQPLYNKSIAKWKPFHEQLKPAINILEDELECSF